MDADVAEQFEGVALHERLGLAWQPDPLDNSIELDHVNQETARVLQAMAVFEEAPRELNSDPGQPGHELAHLEAKLDVLLSLVGSLLAARETRVSDHSMVLRAGSVEWAGAAGQGFWPDMPDTGSGGNTRETRVSQQGDLFSPGQVFKRSRKLVGLFHAGTRWAAANEYDDIPGLHWLIALAFDR